MNAHWRVRRTVSAQDAGQQRWDLAYQCLLRWREESSGPPFRETDGQDGDIKEAPHGCRPVCAGVNPPTATDPDH
jgi:hypothetical protein